MLPVPRLPLATFLVVAVTLAAGPPAAPQTAQDQPRPAVRPRVQVREARLDVPMDPDRARQLYVSTDPAHHSIGRNFEADVEAKRQSDARYPRLCAGLLECTKVTYRSRVGDLDIPAYLFQPLETRSPRGHAAMVWVHGGVHGNWPITMFPFVKEAVQRGYVVIAPEYRGSTGYGQAHHMAIDYGGHEVDDVISAVDHLRTLPHVDPERIGVMGWSHGGYIALFTVLRDEPVFRAAAALVPVTNLVFRLSYKGPAYQWEFATQPRIGGLPFERREVYIERSPVFHIDRLRTPLLVHVATNDTDVDFVEGQQLIDALRARKPDLAETKVYVDPPPGPAGGGHTFDRRVDAETLERLDTPEQIDSWNRIWTFFEWHLRPRAQGTADRAAVR